ncbi:MAG: fumarylacetoacetate hydrolase family protein [Planctomycetales bacterium]|nr:fumarylacetoacetate hydrolase family protein [Planctomycetales bacterium]
MRWVTYYRNLECRPGAVVADSNGVDRVVDAAEACPGSPDSLQQLLASGDAVIANVWDKCQAGDGPALAEVALAPPIVTPQKILCVGLNYADHAAETGATVGEEPVIFNKLPTCLRGHDQAIELPPESSKVDFEAELVAVIGKAARRVSRAAALEHVAGYCCGHDVSARDWQKHKPGGQWLLGKSFDSFAPLGPWIATVDELGDPANLPIQFRLNGEVMQNSSTSQLIFPVDFLVSYLSHVCTLMPGDLIYTGTPPGVGAARKPPVFMQPGDVAEVTIEGLGTLRNPVVAAPS